MKKIYTILAALLLVTSVYAQAPSKMSYQAVVRDANNVLIKNQKIGMQISILQGSITGTVICIETHTPTSNANGLVSLEIGNGTLIAGDFITIDWANGPYFIKTETDPDGGTNYTISGTSQLMSVPFALYAKTAENISGGEIDPVFGASVAQGINSGDTANWNQTLVEQDPVFGYSVAHGITPLDTFNWNHHTIDTDTQLDSNGIAAFGYVAGAHTIDTDTQLDSSGIANLGYVAGAHTVDTDTHIDSVGVDALGFVAGEHTIDTDTHLDAAGVAALGFSSGSHTVKYTDAEAVSAVGAHTVDTDTHLDAAGVVALGFVAGSHTTKYTDVEAVTAVGSHTVDTDTHLDAAGVAALGFVVGSHTIKYTDAEAVTAVGSHTVDTDTHLDAAGVAALGFTSGAHMVKYTDAEAVTAVGSHTVDTDTHLDAAGVAALGFSSGSHTTKYTDAEAVTAVGSHTIDTDTHIDSAGIAGLGFVAGGQIDSTAISNMGFIQENVSNTELALFTINNSTDISSSITNYVKLSNSGSFTPNTNVFELQTSGNFGIKIKKGGFLTVSINQSLISSGGGGYVGIQVLQNGNIVSSGIISNTNGAFDGISLSTSIKVNANDVITMMFLENGVASISYVSFSHFSNYSFSWYRN